MSVSVEKLEKNMVKLTVTVSPEDFEKAIERAYQKQKGSINIQGFRKGKAPRNVIEKLYGTGIFYEEAVNDCINSTYPEAAKESGEDIVSSPSIGVEKVGAEEGLVYTAEVAVKPPVSLGKYMGVEVEDFSAEVTDEEVDAAIEKQREAAAKMEQVDRPIKDGDIVTLDFEGFIDGVAFDGGKGENYPLTIGSGSFIPGFEEQLIGATVGEKDVVVSFPEDYHVDDLKGKEATFKCTIKEVREKVLPELDDAFADEVSEFSTMAEYRADVKKNLEVEKEKTAKTDKENAVVKAIADDASIDIPEAMIDTQAQQMMDEFAQRMQMQGLSLEQYFQFTGSSKEKFAEEVRPQAIERIKTRLVLEEIVKQDKIEASEEDFEEEVAKMAEQYHMEADKIKEILGENKETMMNDLAVQKAVTIVTDAAVTKKASK